MTLAQLVVFGLGVIRDITAAVVDATNGHITPEQALERIAAAARQDAAVDARVDDRLNQKFGEEDGQ